MSWKIAVSHRECPFMIYKDDHVEPKNWMECVYDSDDRKDCEQSTCPLAIKAMTKEAFQVGSQTASFYSHNLFTNIFIRHFRLESQRKSVSRLKKIMMKKVDKGRKPAHTANSSRGVHMKVDVLLRDGEKYSGQYVAMKSFTDHEIITAGVKPEKVLKDAERKGFDHPVMIFIPDKDTVVSG